MIKTLKSELNLRPTYDDMIGMIEDADKENRPPIEKQLIEEQQYLGIISLEVNLIILIF